MNTPLHYRDLKLSEKPVTHAHSKRIYETFVVSTTLIFAHRTGSYVSSDTCIRTIITRYCPHSKVSNTSIQFSGNGEISVLQTYIVYNNLTVMTLFI